MLYKSSHAGTLKGRIPFPIDGIRTLPFYFDAEVDQLRTSVLREAAIPPPAALFPVESHVRSSRVETLRDSCGATLRRFTQYCNRHFHFFFTFFSIPGAV